MNWLTVGNTNWHVWPMFIIPALLALLFLSTAAGAVQAEATHGMVASGHPTATAAGVRVLQAGGNAIDAAVAVALTLGVVDGENSGIGGGCFLLIRRADGSLVAIDGREKAPAAATADMFVRNGKADPKLSQVGALASGVPGALAAYEYAVEHERSLPEKIQVGLARRGHSLRRLASIGISQIVARSPDGAGFVGAADPRAYGNAAGW